MFIHGFIADNLQPSFHVSGITRGTASLVLQQFGRAKRIMLGTRTRNGRAR